MFRPRTAELSKVFCGAMALMLVTAMAALGDTIILKDGQKLSGRVIGESAEKTAIKLDSGAVRALKKWSALCAQHLPDTPRMIILGRSVAATACQEKVMSDSCLDSISRSPRGRICLNGEWEFTKGPERMPAGDAAWERCVTPHPSFSCESGWYRLKFFLPRFLAADDRRFLVRIGRVNHYARVFVNGAFAGEHFGTRTPLRVEVTESLRFGAENELLLFVHDGTGRYVDSALGEASDAAEHLRTAFYLFRDCMGIEDDVWLIWRPLLHVSTSQIDTRLREGRIDLKITVRNDHAEPQKFALAPCVRSGAERLIEFPQLHGEVESRSETTCEFSASSDSLQPWPGDDGQHPLYHLCTEISNARGARTDLAYERFGATEVRADLGRLMLNDEPVFVIGDMQMPTFYNRQWLALFFAVLKQANIHAVAAHTDNFPEVVYDVADELGMLVIAETLCGGPAGINLGIAPWARRFPNASWPAHMLDEVASWAAGDRNRPSLLFRAASCAMTASPWALQWSNDIYDVLQQHDPRHPIMGPPGGKADILALDVTHVHRTGGLPQLECPAEMPAFIKEYHSPPKPEQLYDTDYLIDLLKCVKQHGAHGLLATHFISWRPVGDSDELMDMTWGLATGPGSLFTAVKEVQINWPSFSGPGMKIESASPVDVLLNWCDPEKPLFQPQPIFDALGQEKFFSPMPPLSHTRAPELLVQLSGVPEAGSRPYVFLCPAESQCTEPIGIMADSKGIAWFQLREGGAYNMILSCIGAATTARQVDLAPQPLELAPGYEYLQRTELCAAPH